VVISCVLPAVIQNYAGVANVQSTLEVKIHL
jgi:hypothetical protein